MATSSTPRPTPPFKRMLCAFCSEPVTPACKCQRRDQLVSLAQPAQKTALIEDCALHLELQASLMLLDPESDRQKHFYEAAAILRALTKPIVHGSQEIELLPFRV
jgi:hypothetical protein